MTYETTASGQSAGEHSYRHGPGYGRGGDYFWWVRAPGFHPFKLFTVLVGFAIFPPLGIAALAYFLWNSRGWHRGGWAHASGRGSSCGRRMRRSGNAALDEHQARVMQDLEDERQRFREHRAEERRKRDQQAYEAFRATQAAEAAKPADDGK